MAAIGLALAALCAASILGGVDAGTVTAVWIDAIYFGPRVLSDPVAAYILVIALYEGTPARPVTTTRLRPIARGRAQNAGLCDSEG